MKVVSIIGARPQFIKCAPVSRELRHVAREVLVHTGQHYDDGMSGVFFRELGLPEPDYNLDVGSGSHGQQTGEMLRKIEEILLKEQPDVVLVYGDTNSTLAGALAAAKLHVPVAHVEAGLRSFNRRMPEEINRVMTDHLSDLLLSPTETAVGNLRREGVTTGVHLVGDVMYDALLDSVEGAKQMSTILDRLKLEPRRYILATVHRAENTDQLSRLEGIMAAFSSLANSGRTIVFPVHPRTRKQLRKLSFDCPERLLMVDPVPYLDMVLLEAMAQLIATDSGGIQKEAHWLGVPCITLRQETEWIETVDSGWNRLVGTIPDHIVNAAQEARPGRSNSWPWSRGDASKSVARLVAQCRCDPLVDGWQTG
jgi:UDP-N-acetylglucosamine 2-epimerase